MLLVDEKLDVDLQQQYMDMGDGLLKPSGLCVLFHVDGDNGVSPFYL